MGEYGPIPSLPPTCLLVKRSLAAGCWVQGRLTSPYVLRSAEAKLVEQVMKVG